MATAPRLLILDAYDATGVAMLKSQGLPAAATLFSDLVAAYRPDAAVETCAIGLEESVVPDAAALAEFDAILWSGSNLGVYQDLPVVHRQLALAKLGFALGVPMFGSCWGAQLCCVAAGGACEVSPKGREFGIARGIRLNDAGRAHPMFAGKPDVFDALASHGDFITRLPEGGTLLASNDHSAVQGVVIEHDKGRFWGVQYHPEFTFDVIGGLVRGREAELTAQGFLAGAEDAARVSAAFRALHADPSRPDLRWQYGADDTVLSEPVRAREVANFLASV